MAAFVVNHVLGGGSFSSRLYREVREVRGLAYSVFSTLVPLEHAALFMTGTATRADRTGQTLDVLQSEIRRLAEDGPTEEELAKIIGILDKDILVEGALRRNIQQNIGRGRSARWSQ
jgi:zinc protease